MEAGFQWEWNPKMEERLWQGHSQGQLGLPIWPKARGGPGTCRAGVSGGEP